MPQNAPTPMPPHPAYTFACSALLLQRLSSVLSSSPAVLLLLAPSTCPLLLGSHELAARLPCPLPCTALLSARSASLLRIATHANKPMLPLSMIHPPCFSSLRFADGFRESAWQSLVPPAAAWIRNAQPLPSLLQFWCRNEAVAFRLAISLNSSTPGCSSVREGPRARAGLRLAAQRDRIWGAGTLVWAFSPKIFHL